MDYFFVWTEVKKKKNLKIDLLFFIKETTVF